MRGSAAFRTGVAPGGVLAGPWVRDPLWTRARAVPSLDLRFADNKSLVDATTGQNLVTFTRASSGTFVGSDGVLRSAVTNEPRFDHNPTTGESLGLLVEEQRTNSTTHSQDFGNVAISKNNATVTDNTATSPAGDNTADKIVEDAASSEHGLTLPSFSYAASTAYTFTIFAKAVERNRLRVLLPEASFGQNKVAWFDLSNGSVIQTSGTGITTSVTAYFNGWYRCAISATTTIAIVGTAAQLRLVSSGTSTSYIGDNTSGLLLWGAQIEVGAFPTSYIATTTAAATRSADVASITGSAFTGFYRQDAFTLYMDIVRGYSGNFPAFPNFAAFTDGTTSNNLAIYGTQNNQNITNFGIQSGGVTQNDFVARPSNFPGPNLVAQTLATNSSMFTLNGILTTEDTSITMPVGINQFRIGSDRTGQSQWGGTIRRICYWPQRLGNQVLQSITQ